MRFILDTNAASDPAKLRPNPQLTAWLAAADPATVYLSVPTIAEFEYGIMAARRSNHPRAETLEHSVRHLIRDAQILDLDKEAALILGRMWAEPTLRNFITTQPGARKIQRGSDLQIAAITLRHDATLVTRNIQDFVQIRRQFGPMRLYDPFTGAQH
jgi:predicted nucleic acid-binding protein